MISAEKVKGKCSSLQGGENKREARRQREGGKEGPREGRSTNITILINQKNPYFC